MGLLDQFKAYVEANTPRSTRPKVSPAKVFNEGLLNPNAYNKPAADRFKDSLFGLLGVVPGVGDAASAAESADLFNRGENVAGSMAALGALPLVPSIGGMFIGKGAKTWDALKAQQAEEMLAKGIDPREVWKQTGTMRGVDNALRQEIPDNTSRMAGIDPTDEIISAYKTGGISALKQRKQDLSDYVRPYQRKNYRQDIDNVFHHNMLMDSYPDLMHYGKYEYDWENPIIGEGSYYSNKPNAEYAYDLIKLSPADEKTANSAMLHEFQHAIQQHEEWAKGGSPDMMRQELAGGDLTGLYSPEELHNAYRRLAGEAEARLTQARMNMTMPERLQSYPYDMLDVPQEQLIVRGLLK